MKIGILQTGHVAKPLADRYGDYVALYARLLEGHGLTFQGYPVVDGVFPKRVDEADGWLVTGSRHGVYEPHAWISPLEQFLRRAYGAGVPIVGICFGHQILAQALGGTVEKFSGGWSVGLTEYRLEGFRPGTRLNAWHQDQIVTPPACASVVGESDQCRYAALAYDDRAYTLQPHPEFDSAFMADLIEARRDVLPAEIAEQARHGLDGANSAPETAEHIAAFFKQSRRTGTTPADQTP